MKNPKEITTLVAGACYSVPLYQVTNNGLENVGEGVINFVKGSKEDESVPRQLGYMTETLLSVCMKYLNDVQTGDMKDSDTQDAINRIDEALNCLEERQKKRIARGVAQTYKP